MFKTQEEEGHRGGKTLPQPPYRPRLTHRLGQENRAMAHDPRQTVNSLREYRTSGPQNTEVETKRFRMATINVESMSGKGVEVADMLTRRRVDFCCVQEVMFEGEGARFVGEEKRYKLWWSGGKESRNGVGIMLKEELLENVIVVIGINDRLMKIMMVLGNKMAHVFSALAPQQKETEEEKRRFRELLQDKIAEVPETDILLVGGDMNAEVGQRRDGFEHVMGCYGIGERNGEGEELLWMCQENNLKIVNTMYKKNREHLITYKSGGSEAQSDYILLRHTRKVRAKDCKVIPGEKCLVQHRILCCDLQMKMPKIPNRGEENEDVEAEK